MPDAGGLVIAGDHDDARAYAALLRGVTGTRPVVVLSDDPAASKKIAAFTASGDRWMVAVRMVSEGVDIPRLAVGVFATSVCTALFFAQAVGRFVRARRRGETASVFLPSVPGAAGLRRRTGGRARPRAPPPPVTIAREASWPRRSASATPRTSSTRRRSPRSTRRRTSTGCCTTGASSAPRGSAEEEDFLGLPGLLEPEQVRALLQQAPGRPARRPHPRRPSAPAAAHPAPAAAEPVAPPVSRQPLAALRKELNGLVGAWSHRTGQPHGVIHAELRRACGGPPLPQATADQIQARIATIRRWAFSGR